MAAECHASQESNRWSNITHGITKMRKIMLHSQLKLPTTTAACHLRLPHSAAAYSCWMNARYESGR